MAVETKKTPEVAVKEDEEIIYIPPSIKKKYIEYFSRPGGELAAELINSIVLLVEEIYMSKHCSLEPLEMEGNVLKMKFKVLRPLVKLRSENGLFITLRGFYTEHVFKFTVGNESVTVTVLKNIKGTLLNPTLAQATTSFAHSHLHSTNFNSSSSYEPKSFCLGSSALSSALYGNYVVAGDKNKKVALSRALKGIGKVLHFTESLVHHESISGTPYNYLKSVIEKTWERSEDRNNSDARPYLKKAYHKCLSAIYDDVILNARFPFTLGNPILDRSHAQVPYSANYKEPYMPIVRTDTGFIRFLTELVKPIALEAEDKLDKHHAYKFTNTKFIGAYRFLGDSRLCTPSNIWTGPIPTKFKGSHLKAGYKGIKYDGEGNQTTPISITGNNDDTEEGSDFLTKYIVRSFDMAFKKLVVILLSSFKTRQLLDAHTNPSLGRITISRNIENAHFSIIDQLIADQRTRLGVTEMLFVLSLLIRSTINFNNFNHFLNDK